MIPKRLLLLTPDFPPNYGGVARYLEMLAEYFAPRMHVITTGLLSRYVWPRWFASVRLLIAQQNQYDIAITSHVLPFGTAMWMASWFTKKPYVVIVHGFDVRLAARQAIKRFIAGHVLSHARVVVTNSNALAQEVSRVFRVPLPLTIYPCIGSPRLQPWQKTITDKKSIQFLSVSRLIARKGHIQVLMALSQLKQTGEMPDFQYIIVGDGPMRQTFEDLAQQLHLDEVKFVGEVTDEEKNHLYGQADVFVLPVIDDPIDKEGFGIVFLEAAQFRVPSISTKIEGVDEAIVHGQTGLLVEPGDLGALAQSLLRLASDSAYRSQLGEQAHLRVQTEFTCQNQFSKLEPYL